MLGLILRPFLNWIAEKVFERKCESLSKSERLEHIFAFSYIQRIYSYLSLFFTYSLSVHQLFQFISNLHTSAVSATESCQNVSGLFQDVHAVTVLSALQRDWAIQYRPQRTP